jgi:hypothetical protein
LIVRRAVAVLALIAVSQPAHAQETNIPLSLPGLDNACKLFPDKPLSEATTRGARVDVRCEWGSEVRVEAGRIRGGTAGVDTTDIRQLYDNFKAAQDEFAHAFDDQSDSTVLDKSGIIDCAESRMVMWRVDGVPFHSHFTAYCGGVGINFATSGADYTSEDASKFAQVVRSIMGEKNKQ